MLAFDEDVGDGGGAGKGEVAAIGGEYDAGGRGIDGTGGGFEFSIKKFVEAGVGVWAVGKFCGVELEFFDEGLDALFRGGMAHAAAVPMGEEGAFDEGVEGGFS